MTSIEWTDATWNPVTGCTKVSPGCAHCYAETFAERWRGVPGHPYEQGFDLKLWPERLSLPLSWKKPRRVFVNSMSDLFHEDVPFEFIDLVFAVMALTPQHTYQVLTKRPERMREYLTKPETRGRVARAMDAIRVPVIEGEEERPIPGYPGYWVTNAGRVFSARRGGERTVLRPEVGEQGHSRVTLQGPNGRTRLSVHRLVLEVWDGPPPSEDAQGCHLNGNAQDNRISNLRWGTQADNWDDRTRHGNFRSYSKLSTEEVTEIRRRGAAGESAYAIAQDYPVSDTQIRNILNGMQWVTEPGVEWPLPNCWLGTSVELQRWADVRIPELLAVPAAVRFLSCEPLLGPLDLGRYLRESGVDWPWNKFVDWVIVGGESGPGARPFDLAWARSIVSQCRAAGVAVFVKQLGAKPVSLMEQDDELPRHGWARNQALKLKSRKGGDMAEWPEDLRVREMPQ